MKEDIFAPAPLYKRFFAFVLDAIVASLPAMVMLYLFASSFLTPLPVLYAAPAAGAATIIDLPLKVNHYMNEQIPSAETYKDTELRNVNFSATVARVASVFVILFYLAYAAVSTMLYDGQTVGKYIMKLRVVRRKEQSFNKAAALREIVGKVLLNSTVILPLISIITMIATKDHLAVHDLIGGTRVVSSETRSPAGILDAYDEADANEEDLNEEDSDEEDSDEENANEESV